MRRIVAAERLLSRLATQQKTGQTMPKPSDDAPSHCQQVEPPNVQAGNVL